MTKRHFDFVLTYPKVCPYKVGDTIKTGIQDGNGVLVCFSGVGHVTAILGHGQIKRVLVTIGQGKRRMG